MRPVLLIAANFFREQRILLGLMVAYVVLGGGTLALLPHAPEVDDVLFLIKQHAACAVLLGVALASTAIHNERKSRRILAVLSKGITRGQYLAGMLFGSVSVLIAYLFCLGIITAALLARVGVAAVQGWTLLGITAITTLLVAAITIFYSTFAHPWVALPLTLTTIALPIFPVAALLKQLASWNAGAGVSLLATLVGIALAETLAFWLLAAWAFRNKDIAVAVE
jgi:ABC-type transport system involved in multi-copper enzyme maturation permease subunit